MPAAPRRAHTERSAATRGQLLQATAARVHERDDRTLQGKLRGLAHLIALRCTGPSPHPFRRKPTRPQTAR